MAGINRFALPVQAPFDWPSLLAFLRIRASPGVERVTESAYGRTIGSSGPPQMVSVTYDTSGLSLQVSYTAASCERSTVEAAIRQIFQPDVKTRPIEAFLGRDRRLSAWIARQPGLRVPGGWCAFEIAVRAILGQQVSVPAATTLVGRLVRLAGTQREDEAWLFPTPAQVLQADLRAMGVPGSRLETLRGLAALFFEHGDHCMAQPDIRERLLAIKGVGNWTAGYILMRAAESKDHWPEGDLVLRKALSKTAAPIASNRLEQAFRGWSPYRGYATIHIWKAFSAGKNARLGGQTGLN
jgi:AraC family transcriptional regulator, regulatory protein of adaptative response / DNA-3-methyladenine glycosylase II